MINKNLSTVYAYNNKTLGVALTTRGSLCPYIAHLSECKTPEIYGLEICIISFQNYRLCIQLNRLKESYYLRPTKLFLFYFSLY